jgi:hypothetical protein
MKKLSVLKNIFYSVKPIVPRSIQLSLRRCIARYLKKKYVGIWPINEAASQPPVGWKGWPNGKKFALLLQHDVDTSRGSEKCNNLMDLEAKLNFKSSFFIVPERYHVSKELLSTIKRRGFGLGLHGLKHDGKLFVSYEHFCRCAVRINAYLREWDTKGFSSPSMHHRHEWMHQIEMSYCTSTFDTDPFEPQPDSANTIFPFVVENESDGKRFIELPYTLPQDFLLFIILREKTNEIWKKKIDWIVKHNGMVLMNTHPDYMNFISNSKNRPEEYPVRLYSEILSYFHQTYQGQFWNPLSQELAEYISKEVS